MIAAAKSASMRVKRASVRATRRGREPERSCVACRAVAPVSELLRLTVSPDGELVLDSRRRLGGRGAHVCRDRACIERAVARRAFDRALRAQPGYPPAKRLLRDVCGAFVRRAETLLAEANGGRHLRVGASAVEEALRRGRVACVLFAADAARAARFREAGERCDAPTIEVADKTALGRLVGRGPTGVVAVTEPGLARAIGDALAVAKRVS